MNHRTRIYFATLFCLSISSMACSPPGQRLLTVQIESNGNVEYEGIRGVPDSTPVVQMWDVIGDIPFEYIAKNGSFVNDKKTTRELKGALVVRIKHVNKELANASLTRLTLRSSDAGALWSLDGAEVKRIKVSAGEKKNENGKTMP